MNSFLEIERECVKLLNLEYVCYIGLNLLHEVQKMALNAFNFLFHKHLIIISFAHMFKLWKYGLSKGYTNVYGYRLVY